MSDERPQAEAECLDVTAECEAGHVQRITLHGHTRSQAELFAGLLDGTSPAYVAPPGADPNSPIGKCGICGRPFKAKVTPHNQSSEE